MREVRTHTHTYIYLKYISPIYKDHIFIYLKISINIQITLPFHKLIFIEDKDGSSMASLPKKKIYITKD